MGDVSTGAQVAKNIAAVLRAGRAGVPRDLEKVGLDLTNELRLELSKPGTGRVYTTLFFTYQGNAIPYGTRPPHQASAPGEPPAPDTGQLRASYGHNVERELNGATVAIGSGSAYAAYLEFGTSKVAARPHLRPVIARNHGDIRDTVGDGIRGREKAMARRLGGRG
jgi:HK97 gp10 family phage protein